MVRATRHNLAMGISWISASFWAFLRLLILASAAVAGGAILLMIAVTCLDIVLRAAGRPFVGSYDIVRFAGAITIAGALPYTSAVKGHVAIEYFFLKLNRIGRIVVDTLCRIIILGLFSTFAWQCVQYGQSLKRANTVSLTLELPLFWIPYVLAASFLLTALVVLHNLLHPGREIIKP